MLSFILSTQEGHDLTSSSSNRQVALFPAECHGVSGICGSDADLKHQGDESVNVSDVKVPKYIKTSVTLKSQLLLLNNWQQTNIK